MHKILLLGAGGHIGQTLQQQNDALWELVPMTHKDLDITDVHALRYAIEAHKPDLIINAAAISSIAQAEKDEEQATRVNFIAVAALAGLCSEHDIPLIHLSTNYVFDGQTDKPYTTEDILNPINIYGKTKYLAEEAVRECMLFAVTLRISTVFSLTRSNLLTNILRDFEEKGETTAAEDQIISPTPAWAVVDGLHKIANAILRGKVDGYGLYHLAGPAASRLEFAQAVAEDYTSFSGKTPRVIGAQYAAIKELQAIPRPLYVALDCEKTQRVYGISPITWRESLKEYVRAYATNKNA